MEKSQIETFSHWREKRYNLLFSKCKSLKIENLVVGHHLDDLFENFYKNDQGKRLKGLTSLEKNKY